MFAFVHLLWWCSRISLLSGVGVFGVRRGNKDNIPALYSSPTKNTGHDDAGPRESVGGRGGTQDGEGSPRQRYT